MTSKEIIVKHLQDKKELQDSLEIGSPSKSGVIKVYCDFNKPKECKEKIDNALKLRSYAFDKVFKGLPNGEASKGTPPENPVKSPSRQANNHEVDSSV